MSWQNALRIGRRIADCLAEAHDRSIIHRDVKPSNVLITRTGEVKLADFGMARILGSEELNPDLNDTPITVTGVAIGTPFYMSPEQATGDQILGAASDTYALACVPYEMLVGEPPYSGNTAQAVLGKIIAGGPVSTTSHRLSIPANVDAALHA